MTRGGAKKALAAIVGSLGQPLIGSVAALLVGVSCVAGWAAQTAAPDFYQRHCFGIRAAPHWHTLWSAALLATAGFWCVHTLALCGRAAVTRVSQRSLWVSLGIAELGLAIGATLYVRLEVYPPEERFVVSADPVNIHGERYCAVRIESMSRRRGRQRPVVAWLERKIGTLTDRLRVSRGLPWTTASGTYELRLEHAAIATHGAIVRHGHQRVELRTNQPALAGSDILVLHGVQNPGTDSAIATPKADISIGTQRTLLPLDPEWTGENALLGLKESPILVLRAHKRLAASLALVGLACLAMGGLLFVASRRWWRAS